MTYADVLSGLCHDFVESITYACIVKANIGCSMIRRIKLMKLLGMAKQKSRLYLNNSFSNSTLINGLTP